MGHTLYVIGIGPGHPDYMVPRAHKVIAEAHVVVGSARALEDFAVAGQKTFPITGKLGEMAAFVREELRFGNIAVLVSGDTGYYSLLPYLQRTFPETEIQVIAGISSVTFAFARLGEVWQDADLLSFHGRIPDSDKLAYRPGKKLGLLTDGDYNPARIAQILLEHGWPTDTKSAACERLSYEDEHIVRRSLEDIATLEGFSHSVLVVLG